MNLRTAFARAAKKATIGMCILATLFMAACGYPTHQLGQEEGLRGETRIEQTYSDGTRENVLVIQGSQLQGENHYVHNGTLRIEGSIPARTAVEVRGGKLEVNGNVGDEAQLEARLPVNTHQETHIVLMPMFISNGKTTSVMYIPTPVTSTVEDGLTHPADTGPAISVSGQIGNNVKATTNGGIRASGWGTEFRAKTGYGRTLQQAPAPAVSASARAPAPG